jgi:hypothetical protein
MHEQEDDPFRTSWDLSGGLDAIVVRQCLWGIQHAGQRQAAKTNA